MSDGIVSDNLLTHQQVMYRNGKKICDECDLPWDECAHHWHDDAPDWKGSNREPVEFLMADGSIRAGEFSLEDTSFTGEESIPIWHVEFPGGERVCFYESSIKGWRKVIG